MSNSSTSESLSFPQAISATQSLMQEMEAGDLEENEIAERISSLFKSKQGGRGFFVAYLTSNSSLADKPSPGVLDGFIAATKVSTELLIKNLAMSTAMVVAHNRNGDLENAAASQRVCLRTSNIIKQLESKAIELELQLLYGTIQNGQGKYQEFLIRWDYDLEQKKAIQESISNLT